VPLIDQNESFLSDLESYSALMFTRHEIAVIMEVDPVELSELLRETQCPAFRAFQRGRLKREAELRKGIFDLAQNGSSPAQTMAIKLIENAKADDL
jgi:hypothetical protein